MGYVKTTSTIGDMIGKQVRLTKRMDSMIGYFEVDTIVTITDVDKYRGYSFTDNEGNEVIEAGWDGFKVLE